MPDPIVSSPASGSPGASEPEAYELSTAHLDARSADFLDEVRQRWSRSSLVLAGTALAALASPLVALMGQLGFFQFRPRRILSRRALERLRTDLGERAVLNMSWLMSWRKIFAIECEDALWRDAVGIFLERADLILVDVTRNREALLWELNACIQRNLTDRVVLIAHAPVKNPHAFDWLALALPGVLGELPRFTYFDDGGCRNGVEFQKLVVRQLASRPAAAADGSAHVLRQRIRRSLLGVGVAVTATLLFLLPYIAPSLAGSFSPSMIQVREAYLLGGDESAKRRLVTEFAEETRLWVLAQAGKHEPQLNALLEQVADARDLATLEGICLPRRRSPAAPWAP